MTESDPTTALRAAFTAEVARIRSRRDLSDDGKKRQLARAYVTTRDKMRKIADAGRGDAEARRAELHRELFGIANPNNPSAVISARDAADRADQCTKADAAAELLTRALENGDEALARAVAARAATRSIASIGNGWATVLEQWGLAQPAARQDSLDELMSLISPQGATRRLAGAMSLSVAKPAELKTVPNVERLARDADRTDEDQELHPLFDNRRMRDRLGKG